MLSSKEQWSSLKKRVVSVEFEKRLTSVELEKASCECRVRYYECQARKGERRMSCSKGEFQVGRREYKVKKSHLASVEFEKAANVMFERQVSSWKARV